MAITFDGATKRIVLDSTTTSAALIWSAWVDWLQADTDNGRWSEAMRQAGGDDLGGGLSIPVYIFLKNDWKVRPMESSHTLTITGNLFVDGSGDAVVPTLGTYQVLVKLTVPVLAMGISTSGSTAPTAAENAAAVLSAAQVTPIHANVQAGQSEIADAVWNKTLP